jgi:hypothetical protein
MIIYKKIIKYFYHLRAVDFSNFSHGHVTRLTDTSFKFIGYHIDRRVSIEFQNGKWEMGNKDW